MMVQGGICEACYQEPKQSKDLHLDHIKPLADGGDAYDLDNLQFLCRSCHGKKSIEEMRGRGGVNI